MEYFRRVYGVFQEGLGGISEGSRSKLRSDSPAFFFLLFSSFRRISIKFDQRLSAALMTLKKNLTDHEGIM